MPRDAIRYAWHDALHGVTQRDSGVVRVTELCYNGDCEAVGAWRSLASALAWGARGREFKSPRSDQLHSAYAPELRFRGFFDLRGCAGGVVQWN